MPEFVIRENRLFDENFEFKMPPRSSLLFTRFISEMLVSCTLAIKSYCVLFKSHCSQIYKRLSVMSPLVFKASSGHRLVAIFTVMY